MDWKELQFAAQQLGVRLHTLQVQKADAFDQPFKAAMQGRSKALIVLPHAITNYSREDIVTLAAKHRLPTMYGVSVYVISAASFLWTAPSRVALSRRLLCR
jgi:hypothetical protein